MLSKGLNKQIEIEMHGNKNIANTCNMKFLGLTLNNTLSRKNPYSYYNTQTKFS